MKDVKSPAVTTPDTHEAVPPSPLQHPQAGAAAGIAPQMFRSNMTELALPETPGTLAALGAVPRVFHIPVGGELRLGSDSTNRHGHIWWDKAGSIGETQREPSKCHRLTLLLSQITRIA